MVIPALLRKVVILGKVTILVTLGLPAGGSGLNNVVFLVPPAG